MSMPYIYRPPMNPFEYTPYHSYPSRPSTPLISGIASFPNPPCSLPPSPHPANIPLPSSFPPSPYPYSLPPSPHPTSIPLPSSFPSSPYVYPMTGNVLLPGPMPVRVPQAGLLFNTSLPYQRPFRSSPRHPPFRPCGPYSLYINSWINAEFPRSDFYFDLSSTSFAPMRLYELGRSEPLPPEELFQLATYPSLTRLRILCDALPKWPIELSWQAGSYLPNPPPITVYDVLRAIHSSLHTQTSSADWAEVSKAQEAAVLRAFQNRCDCIPRNYQVERANGIKRIDYLLGKTKLEGLFRVGNLDGLEVVKLIVS